MICALTIGCSGRINVPEDVVSSSLVWLSDLQAQVALQDFPAALKTVDKLQKEGVVDASNMTDFLTYKARAEMGAGQLDNARLTIAELERGADEDAIVYALRGELAMRGGDRSGAMELFAKAKELDATIKLPKY
jgi:predicted Zn-dependent protease